jgi:O-antigen/teichoic acid export membrane protein
VAQALIHNSAATREDYDTAWTIRLIQAVSAALIIYLTAPLAAQYFDNTNITSVLQLMSLGVVVGGFENIGIVTFQKEMKFGSDFKFLFTKRVIGFLVTIVTAFLLQSYWALVWGGLAARLAGVALSYGMHSYRPRLSLARSREILSFSLWILFKSIGVYFDTTMDRILVGRRFDAEAIGGYTLGKEISSMPTTELLMPLGRVLFPAFVEKRHDRDAFVERLRLATGVQALVAFPACLGVMFVATDLVYLMLGEKWLFIVPLIQIMALTNMVGSLIHSSGYALLALGKVRLQAAIIWLQAFMFLLLVFVLGDDATVVDFAEMRFWVVSIGAIVLLVSVLFQLKVMNLSAYLSALWRPALGSAFMLIILYKLHVLLIETPPVLRMATEVFAGAVSYLLAIVLLWQLMQKPDGAETYALKNLKYLRDRKNNSADVNNT